MKKIWFGFAFIILLAPLGLVAPGGAWGEWELIEVKQRIGFIPQGMNRFHMIIKNFFPDYSLPGLNKNFFQSAMGYILSAVIGICAIVLLFWLLWKLIPEKKS